MRRCSECGAVMIKSLTGPPRCPYCGYDDADRPDDLERDLWQRGTRRGWERAQTWSEE